MNRHLFNGLFLLLLGMFLAPGTHAQAVATDLDNTDAGMYTLGEVVVTESAGPANTPGTTRQITARDIRTRGARTLNDAVALMPGVQVRTATTGTPRINFRGFRSRHTQLLLNGIPFNSTYDGQFDPTIIPVENIGKIDLGFGNQSVLYGQGGLGGVMNVVTQKGEEGVHGMTSLEISEDQTHRERFTLSGKRDAIDFFLSGSMTQGDGFRVSDDFNTTKNEDGGLRKNSDWERQNLFFNLGYTVTDTLELGLVMNYLSGEYGRPPSILDDKKDLFYKSPKYERVTDFDGFSAQINAALDIPGPLSFRGWVFTNTMEEASNRYDDATYTTMKKKNAYAKESDTAVTGGTLQTRYDFEGAGSVTLSLQGEKQSFDAKGTLVDKKNTPQGFDNNWALEIYTASAEYQVSPLERLHLVMGYGYSGLEKESGSDDSKGFFQAGATYDLFDATRIKGSLAKKIRFPSLKQLHETTSGGNPELTTEASYNYELGVEQMLPGNVLIGITGFYIDARDYIEKDDTTDQYENNESYRFQGIELTTEKRFQKNIFIRAGYTYMETEDRSSDTPKDELQYRPEHKLTLEGNYEFKWGLAIYSSLLYVADQYHYSDTTPVVKAALGDYTVVNLKLEQRLFNGNMHLYAGVDNLFDEDYEESYGLPREGSTIYGGVRLSF
ncbi:MAG: TonB-dependent receptor [Desulfobacterium sp.]|nr:TonB-dependent receptor [Desulfobacterium sp.]